MPAHGQGVKVTERVGALRYGTAPAPEAQGQSTGVERRENTFLSALDMPLP